jgi:hypothetical protein
MKRPRGEILMLKKPLVIILVCFFASGCTRAVQTKNFKVIADPPDAAIRVISNAEKKEQRYHSPAAITVELPQEPALAARVVLEVIKERYKPFTTSLRHINDGDTIKIKLEKNDAQQPGYRLPGMPLNKTAYQLKYRLLAPILPEKINHPLGYHALAPIQSDEIRFQDQAISISFAVNEQSFRMNLTNLSPHPLKIRWYQAEYTDIHARRRRLMHSGIRYQDRNNPIPEQVVSSGCTIQENITPVEHVFVSPRTGGYEINPLFDRSDNVTALKGKSFNLFIPIEINRTITPYNFKIMISDVMVMHVED